MKRTLDISSTPRRVCGHRARRLTLAALAGTALIFIALGATADAAGRPTRRVCAATASSPAPATYTVAEGDAWFSVAMAAGITAGALLAANDAGASTVLHPGDVLCLPEGADGPAPKSDATSCASKHTIQKGDSWFEISQSAGVSLAKLLDANNATATTVLQPGDELCLPPGATPVVAANSCVSKRTVAAGESWYVISRSTGVPMSALYAANDASASSSLHPGQSLCLPEVGFGRGLQSTLFKTPPVRGACRFANSWMATRSGHFHVGVDLISPAGTPVIAVASGTLTRQTNGAPSSGNAWWLTTPTGTYFFYAHLSGFANGLKIGSRVSAGDVIGYVGSTGNAVSPHLHFEIHPYGGGPINPYDSIWTVGGCNYDRRYEQAPLS